MSQASALRPSVRARAHAGVLRRTLRREAMRMRQPRHVVAIVLLALVAGIGLAGLWARGDLAGADARAYWAAVRIWLNGGDPYHPAGPFMPYVYAPWLLPAFVPWALLPWDVAWFAWRAANTLLLLWSIGWAYRIRPLATALTVVLLSFSFLANLDTGNVNLLLVLMIWAAQFTGPRTAGLLWALATSMKWVPVVFLPLLAPRARAWGVVLLAVGGALSLLTLSATMVQLQVLFAFPRPARVDYLVFLWCLVPWLWRDPDPRRYLRPATWLGLGRSVVADLRRPEALAARFRHAFGLPSGEPGSSDVALAGPARGSEDG